MDNTRRKRSSREGTKARYVESWKVLFSWHNMCSYAGRICGSVTTSGDERYDHSFSGFATKESAIYKRILLKEWKLDKWIGIVKSRDKEDLDRELQRDLRSRVCSLEDGKKT